MKTLAVLVGLLALCETGWAIYAPYRVPSEAEWQAASAEVRKHLGPHDLIVFAPLWMDQVGRQHLGDKIPLEMAARADNDHYDRVWEISLRGAHAPDARGAKVIEERSFGSLTLRLFYKPIEPVSYDFTSHFWQGQVSEVDRRGIEQRRSTTLLPRVLEVDYQPRRGILAPVAGDHMTRIEFSNVALQSRLIVYTGVHDYYARKVADGAVDFRIIVDGIEQAHIVHHNHDGWKRFELATSAGSKTVRFEISSPQPAWRTFGFHAEAR